MKPAGQKKRFFIVDRAAHGTCNLVEQEEYRKRAVAFIEKWSDRN